MKDRKSIYSFFAIDGITCRPCGKGLISLSGNLFVNAIPFLNNIFEYNKVVKHNEQNEQGKAVQK